MYLAYKCWSCGKVYPEDTKETYCCNRPLRLSVEGDLMLLKKHRPRIHFLKVIDGVDCYLCLEMPAKASPLTTNWDEVTCKKCLGLKKTRNL